MLQLKNDTPFAVAMNTFPAGDGADHLVVAIKATFALGGAPRLAQTQQPVALQDEYLASPDASSLRQASEMHPPKPGTDIVVVGQAHAPRGRPVQQMRVGLEAAGRQKIALVSGDRVWRDAQGRSVSSPAPFVTMPLVYERAYGGTQVLDEAASAMAAEEHNPVGVGFAGTRRVDVRGQALPNIEDPARPLRQWGDVSVPMGFGFVAPAWLPRRAFAGTYDEAWQQTRCPYLPEDFDPRFFNVASAGLTFERPLQGGERFRLANMSPGGLLEFALPQCDFDVRARFAGAPRSLSPQLETVLIEPDEARVCVTWRCALDCDKRPLQVEEVSVAMRRLHGVERT